MMLISLVVAGLSQGRPSGESPWWDGKGRHQELRSFRLVHGVCIEMLRVRPPLTPGKALPD